MYQLNNHPRLLKGKNPAYTKLVSWIEELKAYD